MSGLLLLMLLLGLGTVAYLEAGAIPALIVTVLVLLVEWLAGASILLVLATLLLASIFSVFAFSALRRPLIIRPVFSEFKKASSSMSKAECEERNAGAVWWNAQLFTGRPNWKLLLDTPNHELTAKEQAFLDGPVNTLCAMIDDRLATYHALDFSAETWAYMKKARFFGIIIPENYGGLGFSALAHSTIVTRIATRSISAAVTVMVPNSLGPGELLLHYGTKEQKDHHLPRLAKGEDIPCFALTGPELGNDTAAIPDTGVVCEQINGEGEKELGIKVTWDKPYITLAPVATLLGLAFQVRDPEHLLGDKEDIGITYALIPTGTPGVTTSERRLPLNGTFMNGPTRGKDVFIPIGWVLGGRDHLGKGWRMLMESVATGRCIALPALSTGGTQLAALATGAYARLCRQHNRPNGRFEGNEQALARIGGYAYQMNAIRIMSARAIDAGEHPLVLSAILQFHLTERLRIGLNNAMDLQGDTDSSTDPHNPFGRAYQSMVSTVEGTNILTRSLIIFGQGARHLHPTLFRELEAERDNDEAAFDRVFSQYLGGLLGNSTRAFVLGLTGGRGSRVPVSRVAKYYRSLNRLCAAFALVAGVGSALKGKALLSARLGETLSHLYLASSTLKKYHDDGEPKSDRVLVAWAMQSALSDTQNALHKVLRNYPAKPIAWLLHGLIFPLGRRYRPPGDVPNHEVAQLLIDPDKSRDWLTQTVNPDEQTDAYADRASENTGKTDALIKRVASERLNKSYNSIKNYVVTAHRELHNDPVKPIAWFLRGLNLPLGRRNRLPGDVQDHEVVQLLIDPGDSSNAHADRVSENTEKTDAVTELVAS